MSFKSETWGGWVVSEAEHNELLRFREREPLITALVGIALENWHYDDDCDGCRDERVTAMAVRDFVVNPQSPDND
jgi:hypothetical protein